MIMLSFMYELNMDIGVCQLFKQQEVKNFILEKYCSEWIWVIVLDGVKVFVLLVYYCDYFVCGSNLLLVYGYGFYGSSMDFVFSGSCLSLLDCGFVFVLVYICGGGELGQ